MLTSRSLLRANLITVKSPVELPQPLLCCYQKYRFLHHLSARLVMDARKGKRTQKNVVQSWRAVSTQPRRQEGEGGSGKLQNQLQEMKHSVSMITSSSVNAKHEALDYHAESDARGIKGFKDKDPKPPEKYSVSMEVGWSLMRFIKGRRGVTQEKIKSENGVKLIFPQSEGDDSIIIEGTSVSSVSKASEEIQNIVMQVVNSRELDYSHFVSLPLATHSELVYKLIAFQNRILGLTGSQNNDESNRGAPAIKLKAEGSHVKVSRADIPLVSYLPKESKTTAPEASSSKFRGIDKSIFIKPRTFHLTVLMLKLWNKDRVEAAAKVLKSVSSKVIDVLENRPVSIRLKGLDCMIGSLDKARVLYAPVEDVGDEGRLLRACQVIIDAYAAAGLVLEKDAHNRLKLHATVMNARHRKRNRNRKDEGREWFDARGIFDLYGSEEWGEYAVEEAHLSQRFVFDENGYYHCCASIPFPAQNATLNKSRG